MSNLQDVATRFKDLEASANELKSLLEAQRDGEVSPLLDHDVAAAPSVDRFPASRFPEPRKRERDRLEEILRASEVEEIAEKYQPLETAIVTHIQGLATFKSDIESLIKEEGRRSFWKGIWVNTFFFVLGSAVSAVSLSAGQVFAILGVK